MEFLAKLVLYNNIDFEDYLETKRCIEGIDKETNESVTALEEEYSNLIKSTGVSQDFRDFFGHHYPSVKDEHDTGYNLPIYKQVAVLYMTKRKGTVEDYVKWTALCETTIRRLMEDNDIVEERPKKKKRSE